MTNIAPPLLFYRNSNSMEGIPGPCGPCGKDGPEGPCHCRGLIEEFKKLLQSQFDQIATRLDLLEKTVAYACSDVCRGPGFESSQESWQEHSRVQPIGKESDTKTE